jgi:hypothetical protein
VSTVTEQSAAERMENLHRANVARLHGANVRRSIRKGETRLIEIVGDPLLENQQIGPFVRAVPYVGDGAARRALRYAGVSYDRPLRDVSLRAVQAILARLPERHR